MAKVDHLQQLKGRSFYGKENTSRRGQIRTLHKYVEITPKQATLLKRFIQNENAFYNLLVTHLNSRLKGSPDFFLELSDRNVELFSKLAFCNYNTKLLAEKQSSEIKLPKILEPYRDILFGIQGTKENGMSEKLVVFYEMFYKQISLLPMARGRMASVMIEFCIEQAKTMSMNYGLNEDESYRFSPEALEEATTMQKRHLQLAKDDVEVIWNAVKEQTEITIPYLRSPIIIEPLNLIEHYPDWTLMVIHQDPQEVMVTHSHWEIHFQTTNQEYLYKYMECVNPMSKMKSRHVQGRR